MTDEKLAELRAAVEAERAASTKTPVEHARAIQAHSRVWTVDAMLGLVAYCERANRAGGPESSATLDWVLREHSEALTALATREREDRLAVENERLRSIIERPSVSRALMNDTLGKLVEMTGEHAAKPLPPSTPDKKGISITLLGQVCQQGMVVSRAEGRRMISAGGVKVNGVVEKRWTARVVEGRDLVTGTAQKRVNAAFDLLRSKAETARLREAWFRTELKEQTGTTDEEIDESLALWMEKQVHRPVVNVRMGRAHQHRFKVEDERNRAYSERAKLLAAIAWQCENGDGPRGEAKVWVAQQGDPEWGDWQTILFIESARNGQFSWHFHKDDAHLLVGFRLGENTWDGHTTEDKWERFLSWWSIPRSGPPGQV
jgi:hypothetical protein